MGRVEQGILPPARCARILTLGLERFQGGGQVRKRGCWLRSSAE